MIVKNIFIFLDCTIYDPGLFVIEMKKKKTREIGEAVW